MQVYTLPSSGEKITVTLNGEKALVQFVSDPISAEIPKGFDVNRIHWESFQGLVSAAEAREIHASVVNEFFMNC